MRDRRLNSRRLDTWKEIGAFFGRDERTVKRWESTRGLPVHRVPGSGRATVYAYTSELEQWLKGAETALRDVVERGADPAISPPGNATPDDLAEEGEEEQRGAEPDEARQNLGLHEMASHEPDSLRGEAEVLNAIPLEMSKVRNRRSLLAWFGVAILVVTILSAILLHRHDVGEGRPVITRSKRPVNAEALEFYLKGEYYLQKRTPESLNRAVDNYTQAIVRDPSYAEAYAGLADCYNLLREYTLMPDSEAYPRALAAAKQAIALNDSLSSAHSALAFVDFFWLWDTAGAEREFKRALELDPKSIQAHHWYATFLFHLGRSKESLTEINIAQQLDPSSTSILADKGLILFYDEQPEQAVALLRQMETTEPAFLSPHNYLAGIYLNLGDYNGYLAESEQAAQLVHDDDRLSIAEAGKKALLKAGPESMFHAVLARQNALYDAGRFPAFGLADTCARMGRQQEALNYLRVACLRRESQVAGLRVNPSFRALHHNAEYRKLLVHAGFPPFPD
jgi:Tfp pilus assembly protein PilF